MILFSEKMFSTVQVECFSQFLSIYPQKQTKKVETFGVFKEKSYKSQEEANAVAKLQYWNLTGNRLYYSVFHMASALLLDKGMSAKTHAGVIHLIGEKFIATGLLDKSFGK